MMCKVEDATGPLVLFDPVRQATKKQFIAKHVLHMDRLAAMVSPLSCSRRIVCGLPWMGGMLYMVCG